MTVELKETDEGIFEATVRRDIFEQIPREVQYTVKREGTVENGMIKVESELDEYETVTENHAFKLKETRDIRIDQCLEIYAEITDKYGFIYRLPLTGWTKGGEFAYVGYVDIYDKEGNLLKEG